MSYEPAAAALEFRFVRASGPGGQNVNKVSTAVELRFRPALDPALTDEVRARVLRLAGNRATLDGEVIIQAQRFRSQGLNREDALARLVALVVRALHRPIVRIPTSPGASARRRRVAEKRARSDVKRDRGRVRPDGD
jgi:ribosome-associated protein